MSASSFKWTVKPEVLAKGGIEWNEKILVAVKAVADQIATDAQNRMKVNAPWTDRTGNARAGLFSIAEMAAKDIVAIYLSHGHTVPYGKSLELDYGGKYAIIMPTMQAIMPELVATLNGIF